MYSGRGKENPVPLIVTLSGSCKQEEKGRGLPGFTIAHLRFYDLSFQPVEDTVTATRLTFSNLFFVFCFKQLNNNQTIQNTK